MSVRNTSKTILAQAESISAKEFYEIKTDIGLVKQVITTFENYFKKMDVTLEKLVETSVQMTKMIALHEERIETNTKFTENLESLLSREMLILETKIDTNNNITVAKIESNNLAVMTKLEEAKKEITLKVNKLEGWKYILTGGAMVLMFFVGKFFEGKILLNAAPEQQTTINRTEKTSSVQGDGAFKESSTNTIITPTQSPKRK